MFDIDVHRSPFEKLYLLTKSMAIRSRVVVDGQSGRPTR